jgi:hypothetical protein
MGSTALPSLRRDTKRRRSADPNQKNTRALSYRLFARGLAGHDEGPCDVAVLDEAFAEGHPEGVGALERRRARRFGHRNHLSQGQATTTRDGHRGRWEESTWKQKWPCAKSLSLSLSWSAHPPLLDFRSFASLLAVVRPLPHRIPRVLRS